MANFSVNQTRHFYLVDAVAADETAYKSAAVKTALVKTDVDDSGFYFKYQGAGGSTRSDLISKFDLVIKPVSYEKLRHAKKKVTFKLADEAIVLNDDDNQYYLVGGEDYIVNVDIKNYIGISPSDSTMVKYGAVRGTSTMNLSTFYKKVAISLAKNISREESKIFKVYLETGGSASHVPYGTAITTLGTLVAVSATTAESALTGTYTGVVIEEEEQDWVLGTKRLEFVDFSVYPSSVTVDGVEQPAFMASDVTNVGTVNYIEDGKQIADLEYFCMGERGDQYRNVGFPNVIHTTYFVDPTKKYDILEIHYNTLDEGVSYYKSEKDIELAFEVDANGNHTKINAFIAKLNALKTKANVTLLPTVPTLTNPTVE